MPSSVGPPTGVRSRGLRPVTSPVPPAPGGAIYSCLRTCRCPCSCTLNTPGRHGCGGLPLLVSANLVNDQDVRGVVLHMDQIDAAINQINGANMLYSSLPQFGVVVEPPTRSLAISAGKSAADSRYSTRVPAKAAATQPMRCRRILSRSHDESYGVEGELRTMNHDGGVCSRGESDWGRWRT